jgi:hypothetical protein
MRIGKLKRRGQPTEDGDACEAADRDPDTLNGAASGETPGPRFFLFCWPDEAPFGGVFA